MNQWSFVIAAYAVTIAGAVGITLHSWQTMRRAERAAEKLSRR
ncbi:hypothetical protein [Sphingomonas spermidinifaciens]|nr:hypothetical protein [Sphingomonas spermidinifaciens]